MIEAQLTKVTYSMTTESYLLYNYVCETQSTGKLLETLLRLISNCKNFGNFQYIKIILSNE